MVRLVLEMVDRNPSVLNNCVLPEISIISNIKQDMIPLTYSVLHQKYVVEGLSMRQIATELASSKTRILNALAEYQIPSRSKGTRRFNVTNMPYGKKLNEKGQLIDCPKEKKILGIIKEYKDKGLSVRKICNELEKRKIKTKKGNDNWQPESLRHIIKRSGICD